MSPAPRRGLPCALALAPLVLPLLLGALAAPALAQEGDEAAPLAFFALTPGVTATGRVVEADASASRPSAEGTRIAEYAWRWTQEGEFEPGNRTVSHQYQQAGVHVVTLRVTDDAGRVAFANQTVLVRGSNPDANFYFERIEKEGLGVVVAVNATFSTPSRGAERVVKYEWDWGEGEGFVEGNATETHEYAVAGAYKVRLRVTDDQGRADETLNPLPTETTFLTNLYRLWQERTLFARAALMTLYLAVVSTVLGFVLAVVVALLRISRLPFLRWPALAYIEVLRGTPLFVQILIAWLVLPFLGLKLPILGAGLLALVLNTSAYQAEAIRAGIQAIPSGQMEASLSMGMTYGQAMRFVVLPQAFRLVIPPLGNEFIILLKDTSLVSVIGVVELTQAAQIFANRTFLVLEAFVGVAILYFVMTYTLSLALRRLERKVAIPGLGLSGGP